MTEDPREFGLAAADLRTAADRLYPPADSRLDRAQGTWGEAVRFGRIRSRLRDLADAIDPDEPTDELADDHEPGDDETFYCSTCDARIGMFIRYHGWQHYRGDGTTTRPYEVYDAGHEATP